MAPRKLPRGAYRQDLFSRGGTPLPDTLRRQSGIDLKSLTEEGLVELFAGIGEPPFRARQLLHWIYERDAAELGEITEFSKGLRDTLSSVAYVGAPRLADSRTSADGTVKFLLELKDGTRVETVAIPDEDRLTLCVSSQVGCAMGCTFCRTAHIGFRRNLSFHEITDQILCANRGLEGRRITNVVFMGMGEPLLNLQEVTRAVRLITRYMKISRRRITVSTCGVVPGIEGLARARPMVNLAVSLNAPDDKTRSRIMPVNRKYPLSQLIAACRAFPLPPRQRITFEYVLLAGINDSDVHARRTGKLLKGIPSKVNLIPYNPWPGSLYARPTYDRIRSFQDILVRMGLTAIVRKSKGDDISAACGQLEAGYVSRRRTTR